MKENLEVKVVSVGDSTIGSKLKEALLDAPVIVKDKAPHDIKELFMPSYNEFFSWVLKGVLTFEQINGNGTTDKIPYVPY